MNTPPENPETSGRLSNRSAFYPLRRLARRLLSGRILRRGLFASACLLTLVALFYTEENWRGKQAWEKCRRDLQAKGGQLLVARAGPINPSRILLEADTTPTTEDIRRLFPDNVALPGPSRLRVDASGSNSFKVFLTPAGVVATDYLASTEPLDIDLNVIRKGLGRPYARMEGDYQQPFTMPIPNFVVI